MELVWAAEDFVIAGQPYAEFSTTFSASWSPWGLIGVTWILVRPKVSWQPIETTV